MAWSKTVADLGAIGYGPTPGMAPQDTMAKRPDFECLSHLLVVVGVAVLCAHWPVLRSEALCIDDHQYLTVNPLVQNPSFSSAKRFLLEILKPSTVQGYYQPLTMISLMTDNIWGRQSKNLYPFHRTSLALHVINVMLLVLLIYLLFHDPWVAAVSGLLFGLHPVTAETVAWISERKTLLASFFALLSLICYVGYIQERPRLRFYACCVVMYLLALLCKPTALALPFFMVLMDFWPLERPKGFRAQLAEKAPLLAIFAVFAVVTYVSQSRSGVAHFPAQHGLWRIPLVLCYTVVFYFQKIACPVLLSPHYPFPEPFVFFHPRLFLSVVVTGMIIILLVVSLRWTRAGVISFAMFFIALLPTMKIVSISNEIAADRYLYLPSWALLLLLSSLLTRLIETLRGGWLSRLAVLAPILLLLTGEMICLRSYLAHWHDTLGIYTHMLTVTPNAYKVHHNLGLALLREGRVADAIMHLRRGARLAEYDGVQALPYVTLGETLIRSGNPHSGCAYLEKAVLASKQPSEASLLLAWRLATHPDPGVVNPRRAIELVETVIFLGDNRTARGLDTLAAAYAADGQFALAIETANKALSLAVNVDNDPLAEGIRSRLRLYREGQRYCEDPTVEAWIKALR